MTRKKLFFIAAALFLLLLAACGGAASYAPAAESYGGETAAFDGGDFERAVEEEMAMAEAEFASDDANFGIANTSQDISIQVTQERLIIRTANMSLIVADTEEAMATISRMAEENGGWVVNSSVFQYNETAKTGNITIRVPSSGFNSAIEALRGLAIEVRSESTSGQDVTEEFVDLSARLGNLEATADRVRSFLDETQNVEEALAVNQELSRLESEIEAMKGRLQYLSQSASFSTITVDLTPDIISQPIDTSWKPVQIFRNAIESLVDALQSLAEFGIWFAIYLLPLLLIIGVPLWLVVRFIRRRRQQRRGTAPTETETETAVSNE
jgi:Domain of unknown function (DUF4349)